MWNHPLLMKSFSNLMNHQQWLPRRSAGCSQGKKQNNKVLLNTWRSRHIPAPPVLQDERGGRREAAFINVHYKIRCWFVLTFPMCLELPLSQMCLSWRGCVSPTWEQMCAFDLDSSRAFFCIPPGRMVCLHREAWTGTKPETHTVTQQPIYRFP